MAVSLLILAAIPAYAQNSSSSLNAYAVYVCDKSYVITYSITSGSVDSIKVNDRYSNITVMIQADSDGKLLINLPDSLLNRISINTESELVFFVDQIEVFASVTRTNSNVALEIPFQKGNKQIDIVGTFLIGGGTMTPRKGNSFDATVDGGMGFKLATVTNADTCNFSFDQGKRQLHIEISRTADEEGFFQISLPHEFLGGPYTVLAEGQPAEFESMFSNATGIDTTTISFRYDGDKVHNIDIIGTTAVPEFGTAAITAVAVAMAMIVIARFRHQ